MSKHKNEDAASENVPEVFPDDDRADAAKAEDANRDGQVGDAAQDADGGRRVVNNGDVSDPGNSGAFGTDGEVSGSADKPNG
jgi:hypothetical protein